MGRVNIDVVKLNAVLFKMSQAASERAAKKLRGYIREEIIKSGRINTGEMLEKIDVGPATPHGKEGRAQVQPKTKQYLFQDQGTRGSTARPGHYLRFKPKGSTVYIFRKKTGPISAARFTAKAIRRMSERDWGE